MTGDNIIENLEIEVDRDGEIRFYEVDVVIAWAHSQGRMYERNGDPGEPDSFDFDFSIIHAYEIQENGDKHELGSEYFDELYYDVEDALNDMDIETLKG